MLELIRDADIFILPSLWEGLPISLLEAMFLKKICLVSDVIGNRDVIKSGVNGVICNEAQDYATMIRKIVDGEIDGVSLSEEAHRDVLQDYNADLMAEKYSAIYKMA